MIVAPDSSSQFMELYNNIADTNVGTRRTYTSAMLGYGKLGLKWLVLLFSICRFEAGQTYGSEDFDAEALELNKTMWANGTIIQYISPTPILEGQSVYFWESFDDPDSARRQWQESIALKEDQDGVFKYDGEWAFEVPQQVIFNDDSALVLKSKDKHAAIASKLYRTFVFNSRPLFVQYEVTFQNGMVCGGAYIKLLSLSPTLDLNILTDKTPYTIMFGPEKCGNDYKLHFIFRHKNPINGSFQEKHAKEPSSYLELNYLDKKPHVYTLKLYPNNTFQVHVDGDLVNFGSLISDMIPPVNPPLEIPDISDIKPVNWDERDEIPDIRVKKPDDWDDDVSEKIQDPKAVMPKGWLENEQPMVLDENARRPEDWDEAMNGEWKQQLLKNPVCEGAPGCGLWIAPMIDNPSFKGEWEPPLRSNPNYTGKWLPRNIPNPDYFNDKEPFKMTPVAAVAIEIYTKTDLILFDNFIITDSEQVLQDWTNKTYELKKRVINDSDPEDDIELLSYMNDTLWPWVVAYTVVVGIGLPLALLAACFVSQESKKRDEVKHKTVFKLVEDVENYVRPEANDMSRISDTPVSSRTAKPVDQESLEENRNEFANKATCKFGEDVENNVQTEPTAMTTNLQGSSRFAKPVVKESLKMKRKEFANKGTYNSKLREDAEKHMQTEFSGITKNFNRPVSSRVAKSDAKQSLKKDGDEFTNKGTSNSLDGDKNCVQTEPTRITEKVNAPGCARLPKIAETESLEENNADKKSQEEKRDEFANKKDYSFVEDMENFVYESSAEEESQEEQSEEWEEDWDSLEDEEANNYKLIEDMETYAQMESTAIAALPRSSNKPWSSRSTKSARKESLENLGLDEFAIKKTYNFKFIGYMNDVMQTKPTATSSRFTKPVDKESLELAEVSEFDEDIDDEVRESHEESVEGATVEKPENNTDKKLHGPSAIS